MKRLKIALMAIAIIVSVSGAFAFTKINPGCELQPQYYKFMNWYYPTGQYGYNYFCLQAAGTCTYYRPDPIAQPNFFAPCRIGAYCVIH